MLKERRTSLHKRSRIVVRLAFGFAVASIGAGCLSSRPSAVVTGEAFPPSEAPSVVLVQAKEQSPDPKIKITLPLAIELCVTHNFRLLAGIEKVHQAEHDLTTASLIPNPTLLADYQLIPLQRVNLQNQLGPPQADVILSMPIDWLIFGKRAAARQAAKLGIEAAKYDFADLQRLQIASTVDVVYQVLHTEKMLKHATETHAELTRIETLTQTLVKAGKADKLDLDRIKLAVMEAFLEIHGRELAVSAAKARLRPLIGKSAIDPDFEVDGELTVRVVAAPPKLADIIAIADANRPDLKSDRFTIDQKLAQWELERRRAKPQMAVTPGWTYQNQRDINGYRNGSLFDIGIITTLPITDRNQGNIRKAQSQYREAQQAYRGNRADALAEVETTLSEYEDAVEDVTRNNSPDTLKAANDLRDRTAAAYAAGNRSLADYLSAHQAYRLRHERVIEFEANYWRKLNKLNTVIGAKAFSPDGGDVIRVGTPANEGGRTAHGKFAGRLPTVSGR